jgi:hypothetical protein
MLTDDELAEVTDEERAIVMWCPRSGGDPALEPLSVEQAHQVLGIGPRSAVFPHPGYYVGQPLRPRPWLAAAWD